jgi:hypothetical protein
MWGIGRALTIVAEILELRKNKSPLEIGGNIAARVKLVKQSDSI